ncbi:Flp family type IVb pilin [Kribbella sp. NPDC050124]|uniref:Flp family type IVb pilin n=1 Tax=Kribbella sp. NPDC050124 TaxID=3364114 RepID=UPI003795D212
MRQLLRFGSQAAHGDRGAAMVEYGLLLMLIAIVVVPALILFGPAIAQLYTDVVGSF